MYHSQIATLITWNYLHIYMFANINLSPTWLSHKNYFYKVYVIRNDTRHFLRFCYICTTMTQTYHLCLVGILLLLLQIKHFMEIQNIYTSNKNKLLIIIPRKHK